LKVHVQLFIITDLFKSFKKKSKNGFDSFLDRLKNHFFLGQSWDEILCDIFGIEKFCLELRITANLLLKFVHDEFAFSF